MRSCARGAHASLRGGEGVEQQAGLGLTHTGQAPDPFEHEVDLGQTAAAQLDDEVPGAGCGVGVLDLGVAADLADCDETPSGFLRTTTPAPVTSTT